MYKSLAGLKQHNCALLHSHEVAREIELTWWLSGNESSAPTLPITDHPHLPLTTRGVLSGNELFAYSRQIQAAFQHNLSAEHSDIIQTLTADGDVTWAEIAAAASVSVQHFIFEPQNGFLLLHQVVAPPACYGLITPSRKCNHHSSILTCFVFSVTVNAAGSVCWQWDVDSM